MAVAALLASGCAFGGGDEPVSPGALTVVPPCHVAGCSAQVCSEREDVVTTCEWRAEYACYQSARCEPQADGLCGWTPTPELLACIEAAGGE